ncbi:MAG: phosphate acyltransferase PlsX [Pseudomonadota bacterium]
MSGTTIISVDGMGGDKGPAPIVAGLSRAAKNDPSLHFIVHGDEAALTRLLRRRRALRDRIEVRHADNVVPMDIKPSRALRSGRGSSMWQAMQSVADGEARVAFSAGNTGAIVALSMLILRRAPGVHRPAIAVHWPAENNDGHNVVLDMGADIRAEAGSLLQYAILGAEYSRLAIGLETPRVGLLNIGSEDTKGHLDLHEAKDLIEALVATGSAGFEFVGFVEGTDITTDGVDVVVTDGFTGNIAMKASEGTAALIRKALKDAFAHSILSRFGALFALTSLNRLRKRIDPRRVNGGVFLGLNGGVVKSHGGADAVGHASALGLAAKMAVDDFPNRVAARLANLNAGEVSQISEAVSGADKK